MKKDWWARLKKALGTASPDFVAATLRQIEIASRLPHEGTSEVAVNAVLAIIEGAQPRNEIEAVAAVQLACAHAAAMHVLNSLRQEVGFERRLHLAVPGDGNAVSPCHQRQGAARRPAGRGGAQAALLVETAVARTTIASRLQYVNAITTARTGPEKDKKAEVEIDALWGEVKAATLRAAKRRARA